MTVTELVHVFVPLDVVVTVFVQLRPQTPLVHEALLPEPPQPDPFVSLVHPVVLTPGWQLWQSLLGFAAFAA